MGNKAVIVPFIFVAMLGASAAFLLSPLPADASRGDRPAGISDVLLQRLCDRQEALKGRLGWYFVHPSFCEDEPSPEEPSVTLTAEPMTITAGSSSTLTWNSENADSCTASDGWSGAKAVDDSESVSPTVTTTYTITCVGDGGSANDSVTVTVNQPEPEDPTLDLTATPTTINEGSSSLLSWSTTNATSCEKSGGWSGATTTSGTLSVSPSATMTFSMECTGPGGSVSDSVTVNVILAPEEPDAPTVDLVAAPTTVNENSAGNATTTLTWTTTNATSCTASGGTFTGSKATSSTEVLTPTATTTYSLECIGAGGTTTDSATVDFVPEPEPGPSIGHMVISEVLYDAASSTIGSENFNEWVEVFNGTNSAIDLQGWFVGDASSTDMITTSFVISAGGFGVIAASTTPEGVPGGVPVHVLSSSIGTNGFTNTGEGARLLDAGSVLVDQIGYGTTNFFTPVVSIPGSHDGHSVRRVQLTSDTDTAADWEDSDTPNPGQ